MSTVASVDFAEQLRAVAETLREADIDQAEAMYLQLCESDARAREMLVFPVLFAIQRGQTLDALHFIDSLPPDRCPELRALCLNVLGDPTWHGEAMALIDSPDGETAQAMRELLGLPTVAA